MLIFVALHLEDLCSTQNSLGSLLNPLLSIIQPVVLDSLGDARECHSSVA